MSRVDYREVVGRATHDRTEAGGRVKRVRTEDAKAEHGCTGATVSPHPGCSLLV